MLSVHFSIRVPSNQPYTVNAGGSACLPSGTPANNPQHVTLPDTCFMCICNRPVHSDPSKGETHPPASNTSLYHTPTPHPQDTHPSLYHTSTPHPQDRHPSLYHTSTPHPEDTPPSLYPHHTLRTYSTTHPQCHPS